MKTTIGAKIIDNPTTTMLVPLVDPASSVGLEVVGVDGVVDDGGDRLLSLLGVVVVGELVD